MGLLSWTHYRTLLRVEDESAQEWYTQEAFSQAWSSRTLDRNISTQYYYRMPTPRRSQKLFQAKYMAYMPTPEVLKKEIEKQKEIFWLDERKMSLSDMRAEYSCRNT